MKAAETTTIYYVKLNGSLTERDIIVIDVPRDQIKALDVTDWNPESCAALEELVTEYRQYKEKQIQRIFTFEDWLSHTGRDVSEELKWRTFKLNGILEEFKADLAEDVES